MLSQNKIDNLKSIYKLDDATLYQVIDASPTKNPNDYVSWISKQVSIGEISLPLDISKVRQYLTTFDKLKQSYKFKGNKDIQTYTLDALIEVIDRSNDELSNKERIRKLKAEGTSGAKIIYSQNGIVVYEVTDAEDLRELSSNTGWCTVHSGTSKHYLLSGPNYIIYKDGKPYAQYDPNYDLLMDAQHKAFPKGEGLQIVDPIITQIVKALPVLNTILIEPLTREMALKNPEWASLYVIYVIKGEYIDKEAEAIIATHPRLAYYYAEKVLKGRFELGEKAIAAESAWAHNYAVSVIKGRFLEGEAVILADPQYSDTYKSKFLEGEKCKLK